VKDKKIEVTVETYEVLIISRRGGLIRSWCANCGKQVTVISMDEACAAGLSAETISQRGETGRIHLIEIAGDPPFICLNSLIQI
jgi:hypothetical protein